MWRFLRNRRLILRLHYYLGTHILWAHRTVVPAIARLLLSADYYFIINICTETYNYATADYHSFSQSIKPSVQSVRVHAAPCAPMCLNSRPCASMRARASFSTTEFERRRREDRGLHKEVNFGAN